MIDQTASMISRKFFLYIQFNKKETYNIHIIIEKTYFPNNIRWFQFSYCFNILIDGTFMIAFAVEVVSILSEYFH